MMKAGIDCSESSVEVKQDRILVSIAHLLLYVLYRDRFGHDLKTPRLM